MSEDSSNLYTANTKMSANNMFVKAFDALQDHLNGLVNGKNGMPEHISTQSALLDLFFKLVRNLPEESLKEKVSAILTVIRTTEDANLLADLFVLMFQTRDCRGGKGEKMLFYRLLLELYKEYPETVISLLSEVPYYGYYKDFLILLEMIAPLQSSLEFGNLSRLQDAMIDLFAAQLLKDEKELETYRVVAGAVPKLSLAAKYAPREKKHFKAVYNKLVKKLFGKSRTAQEQYRKLVVPLTKALEIPEILMCARRYDEINFKKVPSLCLNRFRKAFLNELVTKKGGHPIPLSESQQETGNRHPDDEKRVQCRKNLQEASAKGKVCGKVLQPHELVSQLMANSRISAVESVVYDAQWAKIKEGVLEGIQKLVSTPDSSGINLGKLVPLVDVSGSMSGTPMEVSIALGILVSELSDPAFRDRFITFHETPTWVSLEGLTCLKDKVVKTQAAPWGGSTHFKTALEMILRVAIEHRLSPEEIPDLIVFSDMQFNQAGRFGETMHDVIKRRFAEAGVEICGRPYPAPKIIYWNLRGDTHGFPVQANTPNTQMLSGFSPSLLKLLLDGEPMVVEEVAEDGTVTQRKITPEETLRKALDDERYNRIRAVLSESSEGVLSKYTFTPPMESSDEEEDDV
jgi:Mg-chelatase subunit ChlD